MSTPHPVLKPALILGSGFHRHVFVGRTEGREALYDWHALIDATAETMAVERPPPRLSPVMRWETLVNTAVQAGYRTPSGKRVAARSTQPFRVEGDARRTVVAVLNAAVDEFPDSPGARVPRLERWGCVISLNFDLGWHPAFDDGGLGETATYEQREGPHRLSRREIERLTRSVVSADGRVPRVWFPNGSVLDASTIRMGLHDYGSAATAIRAGFERLKQWERSLLDGGRARSRDGFGQIAGHMRQASEEGGTRETDLPLSWVAEVLYRPLVIAGVGLSDQEMGLWWLLAQRARNLARIEGAAANPARILVHETDRPEFWASRPFGLEAVTCRDWAEGWERLLAR